MSACKGEYARSGDGWLVFCVRSDCRYRRTTTGEKRAKYLAAKHGNTFQTNQPWPHLGVIAMRCDVCGKYEKPVHMPDAVHGFYCASHCPDCVPGPRARNSNGESVHKNSATTPPTLEGP